MENEPYTDEQSRKDSKYQGEGFWDRVADIGGFIAAGGLSTRRRRLAERKREEEEQSRRGAIGEPIGNEG